MNIKEMKCELKSLSERIKVTKLIVKNYQRENSGNSGMSGVFLKRIQWDFRHKHIAYCLYRGRNIKQIENKNRSYNDPDMAYVDKILSSLQMQKEEVIGK